jgi:hypothetical protein
MRVLLPVACLAVLLPQLAASPAARAADLDYEYAPREVEPPPVYKRREVPPPPPVAYAVPVVPYLRPYPRYYPAYYPRPYLFRRPFPHPFGFGGYGYRRFGYGY